VIRIKRSRNLADLHPGFTGEGLLERIGLLVAAKIEAGENPINWVGKIGDWKVTKPFLQKDSFDKCAYCESATAIVAYGDVEHFRPKSIYWWLALCVDNYVYACQLCNQKFKSDKFPIQGKKLTAPKLPARLPADPAALNRLLRRISPDPVSVVETQLGSKWLKERADLPHPYLDDPELLFAWAVVETNKEVFLVAADKSAKTIKAVEAAEECLGLNREQLRRTRYRIFASLRLPVAAAKVAPASLRREALGAITGMCDSSSQYAGMCRLFAREAEVSI
jgi:hypothetical protein